jgi:hypothetical protein
MLTNNSLFLHQMFALAPPVGMKDWLDANGLFPAIRTPQPALQLFEGVHISSPV